VKTCEDAALADGGGEEFRSAQPSRRARASTLCAVSRGAIDGAGTAGNWGAVARVVGGGSAGGGGTAAGGGGGVAGFACDSPVSLPGIGLAGPRGEGILWGGGVWPEDGGMLFP